MCMRKWVIKKVTEGGKKEERRKGGKEKRKRERRRKRKGEHMDKGAGKTDMAGKPESMYNKVRV